MRTFLKTYAHLTYDIDGYERIYELAETNKRLLYVYSEWKELSKIEAETFSGLAVGMAKSSLGLKDAVEYFRENTKAKK